MDNQRQIHDPIHGLISLDKRLFKIIDTPIFQRLRSLKQLGGAYFVFPGASHNRFEHSIGTCYLAGKWMRELKKRSPEGKIITDEDIFHIEIAALCHDLGHGPFSHTFEDVFLANNTELKKKLAIKFHEHASGVLLRNIIANIPESLGLSPSDIDNICAIILGKVPASWPKNKLFMFEVVSNPYNSIDVDKFDYLARDCYAANLGLDASNVFTRLMQFSEIRKTDEEERHICFGEKEEFNIHQLFSVRYSFHREVYSHPVIKAVEHMIGDILTEASEYLRINEILMDPTLESYYTLTDTVIEEIERSRSMDPKLVRARGLIKQLRERKLYKLACKIKLDAKKSVGMTEVISNALTELPNAFISPVSYNYALKSEHPLLKTWFYTSDSDRAARKHPEDISLMLPSAFLEQYVYVYSRDPTGTDLPNIIPKVKALEDRYEALKLMPSPKAKKLVRQNSIGSLLLTSPTKLNSSKTIVKVNSDPNNGHQSDHDTMDYDGSDEEQNIEVSEEPAKKIQKTSEHLDAKQHINNSANNKKSKKKKNKKQQQQQGTARGKLDFSPSTK